jgi:hypothetical protein
MLYPQKMRRTLVQCTVYSQGIQKTREYNILVKCHSDACRNINIHKIHICAWQGTTPGCSAAPFARGNCSVSKTCPVEGTDQEANNKFFACQRLFHERVYSIRDLEWQIYKKSRNMQL